MASLLPPYPPPPWFDMRDAAPYQSHRSFQKEPKIDLQSGEGCPVIIITFQLTSVTFVR